MNIKIFTIDTGKLRVNLRGHREELDASISVYASNPLPASSMPIFNPVCVHMSHKHTDLTIMLNLNLIRNQILIQFSDWLDTYVVHDGT